MKQDSSGDYIWIPFTHLKIEFNDAKSGWFQYFHYPAACRLQPARLIVNQTRSISDKMKPISARCDILPSAFERYEKIYKNFISTTDTYGIPKRTEKRTDKVKSIKVHVATCENYPSENMKEGYAIRILNNTISLNAHAEWGVLRGLGPG